ncbi:hypothetical protein CMI37_18675 [Candidatus Pacearchaeota archaeon]|nr:hypothetical protein [Candidatus Pacearchaeota archaeon]
MSLTLPTAYSNASKQSNVVENWIVQLGFFNGDAQGEGDGGWDAVLQSDGSANLLNEALDDSEPEVDVDDGRVFQDGQDGDFIKVENEIMKILSISTHTLTVERGAMSTTAAEHDNNTAIYWNNFTPIALSDTTIDSVFYHGVITNKPAIRSSIDLANSTAKTGNISLSVVNFQYKGDDFSAELFLGTRKYINREVRIYSQLPVIINGVMTLSDCLQVYSGRLIDISHDDSSVTLSLTEQRPWDFISIPQTKSDSKTYEPVVYGDFTGNSASAFQTNKTLFPLPLGGTLGNSIYYIAPKSYGSGSRPHYYDKNNDIFIIMEDEADATVAFESVNADSVGITLKRGTFYIRPNATNANNEWSTNPANSYDTDLTTFTQSATLTAAQTGQGSNTNEDYLRIDLPSIDGRITEFKVHIKADVVQTTTTGDVAACAIYESTYSPISVVSRISNGTTSTSGAGAGSAYDEVDLLTGYENAFDIGADVSSAISTTTVKTIGVDDGTKFTVGDLIKIDDEKMLVSAINFTTTPDVLTVHRGYYNSTAATHSDNEDIYKLPDATTPAFLNIEYRSYAQVIVSGNAQAIGYGKVYDVYAIITVENDRVKEPTATADIATKTKELYCGGDGLTESWSGGSAAIQYGHEAHRDMLIRYAGYTTTAPENWSALNTDRSLATWKIRWWALEPIELKKVLEQLQYEFGFIFKFRADGTGSLIHNSGTDTDSAYQASDVDATLKKDDIANLKIKNMSFSELLTKMEINYEKHPAENKYLSSVSSSNSTARTNWNINAKENIKKVNLEMNVGTPATSGASDNNAEFYSYYDKLFGDIKKVISCDIVNPAVSYDLETGDIIQFSNTAGEMPVEPFGDNWSDYYMITDLQRSPGKIKIQAREIG